jgi:hypothetical protein
MNRITENVHNLALDPLKYDGRRPWLICANCGQSLAILHSDLIDKVIRCEQSVKYHA